MPNTVIDVSDPLPPFERAGEPAQRSKALRAPILVAFLALAVGAGCSAGGGAGSLFPSSHARGTSNVSSALPGNVSGALPASSPTPYPASLIACGTGGVPCQVKKNANSSASGSPSGGYTAAQLRSAYGLPASTAGTANGPLVAVVDAFEDRDAESDLATYRSQFGLPACTSKNGCFSKVIMQGVITAPGQIAKQLGLATSTTWEDEIALDLAMVSASCPTCRIMLVEAGGNDLDSLASGVSLAASYHPVAISASWGVVENGNQSGIDAGAQAAFNQPGIAITASAGDMGQVQFPASSPYVTAVGGTSLTQGAGGARGWSETAWTATGTGCSTMFATPAWQTNAQSCGTRAIADISMVADPNPGVAVYSTAEGGWVQLGGTSIGAPFVAGLYAAAGDYGANATGAPALYQNMANLNAVAGGGVSPNGLAGF